MKKKRGGQKGNRNAVKDERKKYFLIFGQRFDIPTGTKIKEWLASRGLSQKAYIDQCIQRDILNEEEEVAGV